MKKIIMMVISLLIVCVGGYLVWNKAFNREPLESYSNDKYTYLDSIGNQQNPNVKDVTFYKDGKEVNKYTCGGTKCYVIPFDSEYDINERKNIIKGNRVLIATTDGINSEYLDNYGGPNFLMNNGNNGYGTIVLYDINSKKEIEKYDNVDALIGGINNFIIKYKDTTYKFLTDDGLIDRSYNKDELVLNCYEGCSLGMNSYDSKNDLLVIKKDNKYGIQKLSTGSMVLNNEYDDIEFIVSGGGASGNIEQPYVKAKKDNKYNLYSKEDMKQITKLGYDNIFYIYKDVLLVYNNKEFSFIDMNEKLVIDTKIPVDELQILLPKYKDGVYIYDTEDGSINISINAGEEIKYEYNYKTKELARKQ